MAIYFIDYENIKNLKGIDELTENDAAIIFYSNNADTLSFSTHFELLKAKAKIEYKYVETGGKNALDFQLSTYLGYIISKNLNLNEKFYIISKDKGFDYIINFWKNEKSIDISKHTNILLKSNVSDELVATTMNDNTPATACALVTTEDNNSNTEIIEKKISEKDKQNGQTKIVKKKSNQIKINLTNTEIKNKLNELNINFKANEKNEIIRILKSCTTKRTINVNLSKLLRDSKKVGQIQKTFKSFIQ